MTFAKSNRTTCLAIAAIVLMLSSVRIACSQQPADDEAWKHYVFMLRSSTLEWQTSDPFVLKIDFQLYDLEGNPAEKGTAQESWSQEGMYFEIQSPSLVERDEDSVDEPKNHNRERYLIRQVLYAISRPFPVITREDFSMHDVSQSPGTGGKCFSLGAEIATKDAPAYCTDADNRLIETSDQFFVLKRTNFRQYHNHQVPMDIDLSYEGRRALSAHVTELDPLPPVSALSTKGTLLAQIPAVDMSSRAVKTKDPKYPKEAKKKQITGTVLITAIIGKQGTTTVMDVIASPDPVLSRAAMDAVQKWTFQPYLLNGQPADVESMIEINFDVY